jgi:hypothetical protein
MMRAAPPCGGTEPARRESVGERRMAGDLLGVREPPSQKVAISRVQGMVAEPSLALTHVVTGVIIGIWLMCHNNSRLCVNAEPFHKKCLHASSVYLSER